MEPFAALTGDIVICLSFFPHCRLRYHLRAGAQDPLLNRKCVINNIS
jgi:hypothetical protein